MTQLFPVTSLLVSAKIRQIPEGFASPTSMSLHAIVSICMALEWRLVLKHFTADVTSALGIFPTLMVPQVHIGCKRFAAPTLTDMELLSSMKSSMFATSANINYNCIMAYHLQLFTIWEHNF